MPATKPVPQYSKGRVSALGIFAEIDTVLARHRQKTSLTLGLPLQEKIREILPTLGIKNLPEEKLKQITSDIAQETTSQTLEDLAKIQVPEQITIVLADSLTQSIINSPELEGKIRADDTKIFAKIVPQAQEIYTQNQDVLEKAAVLANLDQIAKIQDQTEQIKDLIAGSVEQTAEIEAPLTPPAQKEALKADLANYLKAYKEELATQLKITPDNIPTLRELQNVKENAHNLATQKIAATTSKIVPIGQKPTTKIPTASQTANLAQILYLKPPKPPSAPLKLPPGGNVILASPSRVRDAYLSLLSLDQEKLAAALKENSAEIEKYKSKKSLTYKDRLLYQDVLKKHARYTNAQAFHIKQPKKAGAYRTLFARAFGGRAEVASQQAWIAEKYFLTSMPRIVAHNERLAAGAAFGSLGFSFAGINFGSLFSKIRGEALSNITVGMGRAPASPIKNMARKITGIAGGLAGGLLFYFATLGQAALAGALIGGAIGLTAGGIIGAVIPIAALGPFGVFLLPITVPLGMATGALVFGVVGGLIGLGIAAGSATAISMGVGAGVGGVIGGYIGFGIGSAISGAFVAFAAAACAATGVGCILVPIAVVSAPVITAITTAVGALIGSAIGAGIGYVIGNYLISPTVAFAKAAYNSLAGISAPSAGGLLSGVGSFFTGLASTVWGGITTAGGATIGFLSGAGNFLIGLTGLSPSVAAAAVPVAGGISAVAIGGTIVGIVTATTFFNPEADLPTAIAPPGETPFFTVTKSANPNRLENNQLPADITFTITLTAKEKNLTGLQITDELKVQAKNGDFNLTQDKDGNPISPPCADKIPETLAPGATWSCQFTITADTQAGRDFSDSVVANTVTVTATPEGESPVIGNTTATVVIGNPPTICVIFELQGPWSNNEKNNINEVCKALDRSPKIVSLLQKAGTIFFVRVGAGELGSGVCGQVGPTNTVRIACSMEPVSFTKYVIIHELGHVLGNYNESVYNAFIGVYNQEGLIPTYPCEVWGGLDCNTQLGFESFAEMIADYVVSKTHNFNPRSWSGYPGGAWVNPGPGWTNFQNDWPAHYNFAKTEIFGGVEY